MNKFFCTLLLFALSIASLSAQDRTGLSLDYYFGKSSDFDDQIPTPEDILGYQIGEWHISHDQLLMVVRDYCRLSPRLSYKVIGHTYEGRPLVHIYATSSENQENLEELRTTHLDWLSPDVKKKPDLETVPMVINLGYTVHGNEASGLNASVLVLYYLAASQNPDLRSFLDQNVIIIDPCLNPDGAHRFSTWVNSHKNISNPDPSSLSREHDEAWPGGRTNHYWFDLNRDWLLLRHPESRARVAEFHRWKPNILTDHHEMGTNRTFFFQPGIPSRNNPNTPEEAFLFTQKLAEKHAEFLDEIGSLYYTRESFDDFYYGKGSTYPDIHGAVGILFEQASSRGHIQESVNGELSFPFSIRNQLTVSLSTIASASEMRDDMLEYQQAFYQESQKMGESSDVAGKAFFAPGDPQRAHDLAQRLDIHGIPVQYIEEFTFDGAEESTPAFICRSDHPQFRLLKAIFDPVTSFQDSLFYDVSTWTFTYSHNLTVQDLSAQDLRRLSGDLRSIPTTFSTVGAIPESTIAVGFDWSHTHSSRLLVWSLNNGFAPRISDQPIISGEDSLSYGAVVIPLLPGMSPAMREGLLEMAASFDIPLTAFSSGLTQTVDLGSPSLRPARLPKVAIVVGEGISGYEAGEMWHLFDQELGYPVTLIPTSTVGRSGFSDFTHLIMVNGNYQNLQSRQDELQEWVRGGGTILATKASINWLAAQGWSSSRLENLPGRDDIPDFSSFEQSSAVYGADQIGGAIFETIIDRSHPLVFGIPTERLPVFKNSESILVPTQQPFGHPIRYADSPLLSGYISPGNLAGLGGAPAAAVERIGRGRIISLADNPVFRASWPGTRKLVENAVFLSDLMN